MAFLIGHWQILGYGLFVVEARDTGEFLGRIGPLAPPGWPGFEIAWGLARHACGKGYAQEAARAAIDWSFESFPLDRIVSIIHPDNRASQRSPSASASGARPRSSRHSASPASIWELQARGLARLPAGQMR